MCAAATHADPNIFLQANGKHFGGVPFRRKYRFCPGYTRDLPSEPIQRHVARFRNDFPESFSCAARRTLRLRLSRIVRQQGKVSLTYFTLNFADLRFHGIASSRRRWPVFNFSNCFGGVCETRTFVHVQPVYSLSDKNRESGSCRENPLAKRSRRCHLWPEGSVLYRLLPEQGFFSTRTGLRFPQHAFENFVDDLWIGLAARFAHDLTDEELEYAFAAGAVLCRVVRGSLRRLRARAIDFQSRPNPKSETSPPPR